MKTVRAWPRKGHPRKIEFTGKTGIVAGAASGIGKALAEGYAASGGTVIVSDLKQDAAQTLADAITASGGTA